MLLGTLEVPSCPYMQRSSLTRRQDYTTSGGEVMEEAL